MVRALIDCQFPQWRSLPVRHVAATGTVNAIFRIGDRYAARFPLEAGDAEAARRSLEAEAAAAAELAGRTRFRTPEPIALGQPGAGYPLPWSVQTWLPGTVATDTDPGHSAAFALDLAEFIAGVRSIPTLGRTFSGRGRGGELVLRAALGPGDLEWARGKAWAFQQSMGLVWYYADSNPVMAGIGRRTLDRLMADERP